MKPIDYLARLLQLLSVENFLASYWPDQRIAVHGGLHCLEPLGSEREFDNFENFLRAHRARIKAITLKPRWKLSGIYCIIRPGDVLVHEKWPRPVVDGERLEKKLEEEWLEELRDEIDRLKLSDRTD